MTVPQWSFGERLAKARKLADLTQEAMGERLGVSKATVAAWEVERSQPRNFRHVVDRWSEITDVDPSWLLGLDTANGGVNVRSRSMWDDLDIPRIPRGQLALRVA